MSPFHSHTDCLVKFQKTCAANTQLKSVSISQVLTYSTYSMMPDKYSEATPGFAQWQLQYKLCVCEKACHKFTNAEDEKL